MSHLTLNIIAKDLGHDLDTLSENLETYAKQAVGQVAEAAYQTVVSMAAQRLNSNPNWRTAYQDGVKFEQLGESEWMIWLDGDWPNKLESGFQPAGKAELLASKKIVQVGSRAGQPWVQWTKPRKIRGRDYAHADYAAPHRFAHVPFFKKPYSKEAHQGSGDLAKDLAKISVMNKATGEMQPFTETFKDREGRPLEGKVAMVNPPDSWGKNYKNLIKYQHVYPNATQSIYVNFRTVSDKSKGWSPKPFGGYQIFPQVEKWTEEQLQNVVKDLFK